MSLSLTNVRDGIFNNLYLIDEDGNLVNIRDLLTTFTPEDLANLLAVIAQKAPAHNPLFTGSVGINLMNNIDVLDSALFVKGPRKENPSTTGIRLGNSSSTFSGGLSYGLEICSDSNIGSTIDFTYPGTNSYYQGRLLFDNYQGNLSFYVRTSSASSELVSGNRQMLLDSNGNLVVQTSVVTPALTLGTTDLQTTLNSKAPRASPDFTGVVTAPGLIISPIDATFTNPVNFNGTVGGAGLTKSSVGLGNVDNTSDASKTFSQSQITGLTTALNGKANTNGGTYTGDVIVSNAGSPSLTVITTGTTTQQASLKFGVLSNTLNSRFYLDNTGTVKLDVGYTNAYSVYPNGVVKIGRNATDNKVLVLYENGSSTDATTSDNFSGFGINTSTLRYQVPTTQTHKFYAGSTLCFTISSSGGVGPSDIRWKSDIEDIDNALETVCKLQGKKFKYADVEGKQIGFIAQEVFDVQPELVYVDESTDDRFMSLKYDRFSALHNEAIKELSDKVNFLEARLATLEKFFCNAMNI